MINFASGFSFYASFSLPSFRGSLDLRIMFVEKSPLALTSLASRTKEREARYRERRRIIYKGCPGFESEIARACLVPALVIDAHFSSSPQEARHHRGWILEVVVYIHLRFPLTYGPHSVSWTTTYITQACLKVLRYLGPRGWRTRTGGGGVGGERVREMQEGPT